MGPYSNSRSIITSLNLADNASGCGRRNRAAVLVSVALTCYVAHSAIDFSSQFEDYATTLNSTIDDI